MLCFVKKCFIAYLTKILGYKFATALSLGVCVF